MYPLRKISLIKENCITTANDVIMAIKKRRPHENLRRADVAVIWERKSSGYRIVDLRLNRFMQALHFVLTDFLSSEPMLKAVRLLDDPTSVRIYIGTILRKMEQMMSFCAVQEGSDEIVGVLIASNVEKRTNITDFKMILQGDAFRRITKLQNYAILLAQFYEPLNAEKLVRIDVLCVKSYHRMKGVGTALVRSFVDQATRHASACVGEFTSGAAQTIAKRLGFEIYSEIPYKQIGWKEIKFRIFETCYPENYSLACMGFAAPLPRIDRMVPPPPTPTEKSTKKRTNTKDKKKRVKKR